MKRIISSVIIAAIAVSLTACNNETQSSPSGGVIQRPQQSESSNSERRQESTTSESVSDSGSSTSDSAESTPSGNDNEGNKILIAYFMLPATAKCTNPVGINFVCFRCRPCLATARLRPPPQHTKFLPNILCTFCCSGEYTVPETDGVDTVAGASCVVKNGEILGNTQYIAGIIQDTLGGDLFKIETVQEYPGSHSPLLDFAYNEKSNNAKPKLSSQIDNIDEYDAVFVGYPNWNADLPMPLHTFFEEYDFSGKTIIPFATHGGSGFSSTVRTISDLEPNAIVTENNLSVSRNNVPDAEEDVKKWVESLIAE